LQFIYNSFISLTWWHKDPPKRPYVSEYYNLKTEAAVFSKILTIIYRTIRFYVSKGSYLQRFSVPTNLWSV